MFDSENDVNFNLLYYLFGIEIVYQKSHVSITWQFILIYIFSLISIIFEFLIE